MMISVNGEARGLNPGSTVAALLSELNVDARTVAVELNLTIVPRSRYGETALAAGDQVEIVRFIGGG